MKVIYQKTKTLVTKSNNNSSDAISPNYIYGCAGGCGSYCYMKRYNQDKVYVNTNISDIENSITQWAEELTFPKIPNQQDSKYYIVDIGCNTDIALHQKHLIKADYDIDLFSSNLKGLDRILFFYDNYYKLNSTFATKYPSMLNLDVKHFNKKPRVRISLMPQIFSDVLEPNTDKILSRIRDINRLQELGWEVHLNFSPVIVYDNWLEEYRLLFEMIKHRQDLTNVKSEVIFLTNHKHSMLNATDEVKEIIQHSSEVKNNRGIMRYPINNKKKYVKQFTELHNEILGIPIRYIF